MKQALVLLLFIFYAVQIYAQTLVNTTWTVTTGLPETVDWSASCVDASKNLYITGNTQNTNGEGVNLLLTKYSTNGNLLWQVEWDNDNQNEYGVAIVVNSSAIFVCGATGELDGEYSDYAVLKYNLSGVLQWSHVYTNPAIDGYDIATDLGIDAQGNIIITGTSEGAATLSDYCTIKLNGATGTLIWDVRYDYNSKYEGAAKLAIASNGGVSVTGGSGDSWTNWDFCTVRYNSSGVQGTVQRTDNPGFGFDQPFDMKSDSQGNLFVCGQVATTNYGFDAKVIKLDADLNLVYNVSFDGFGLDDCANSLDVDASTGEVYFTGYFTLSNEAKALTVLKLDEDGNQVWDASFPSIYGNSVGNKVIYDEGHVYVAGENNWEDGKDMITISLNKTNGDHRWKRLYDHSELSEHESARGLFVLDTDDIYVVATKNSGNNSSYLAIRYEVFIPPYSVFEDPIDSTIRLVDDQLIIAVPSQFVNQQFANDRDISFAQISQVLPQAVVSTFSTALNYDLASDNRAILAKAFPQITPADTVSTSRLGNEIRIPDLWARFIFFLPSTINVVSANNQLNALNEYVTWSDPNYLGTFFQPNDEFYAEYQNSWNSENEGIAVESVWDSQNGNSNVKVAIVDELVYWGHPEFQDGTVDSKFVNGYNYTDGLPFNLVDHPFISHGTSVASIIGANASDNIGMAGVAGGNVADNPDDLGVELYTLGIGDQLEGNPSALFAYQAINLASLDLDIFGYGTHIINCSFGVQSQTSSILEALKIAHQNEVLVVAARGASSALSIDAFALPATATDAWALSVSSSGSDGGPVLDDSNWDGTFLAFYGGNLDVIAPGLLQHNIGAIDFSVDFPGTLCEVFFENNEYNCFNSTSASSPLVAGFAGLMMSEHNVENGYPNNLAPEDVEFLVENYATDIDASYGVNPLTSQDYPTGYDQWSGSGRVNAANSFLKLQLPNCVVLHKNEPDFVVMDLVEEDVNVFVNTGEYNDVLPYGAGPNYIGNKWKVTYTYLIEMEPNTEILDYWYRSSGSFGNGSANTIESWYGADDITLTNDGTYHIFEISTYTFDIYQWNEISFANAWVPAAPSELSAVISVNLCNYVMGLNVNEVKPNNFTLWPNPTENEINLDFSRGNANPFQVEILSLTGDLLLLSEMNSSSSIKLSTAQLPQGMYICRIRNRGEVQTAKFVKT